jgi:hypothetical protein
MAIGIMKKTSRRAFAKKRNAIKKNKTHPPTYNGRCDGLTNENYEKDFISELEWA